MVTDLFDKRTAKEKLFEFIQHKKIVTTSDVQEWGTLHHSNRAERNARELAEEGKIRRMTPERKAQVFFANPDMREDAYELVDWGYTK